MKIERAWAMPNKNTFTIKPIAELLEKYMGGGGFKEKISSYVLQETSSYQFRNECRRFMEVAVEEHLKDMQIRVNVEQIVKKGESEK